VSRSVRFNLPHTGDGFARDLRHAEHDAVAVERDVAETPRHLIGTAAPLFGDCMLQHAMLQRATHNNAARCKLIMPSRRLSMHQT
jgi:hypothetical protein